MPVLCRWNQLDLAIVLLSIMGITLEEIEVNASLPINPTIIRIMRVLRIARGDYSSQSFCLQFVFNQFCCHADCFESIFVEKAHFFYCYSVQSVSASVWLSGGW